MTTKQKAKELVSKFKFLSYPESDVKFYNPKECALIAVDELIEQQKNMADFLWSEIGYLIAPPVFWEEVKDEINNI